MPPIRFAGTLPLWFVLTTSAAVFVLGIVSEYGGAGEEGATLTADADADEGRASSGTALSESAAKNLRNGIGNRTEVGAQDLLGSYDLARPLESKALAYSKISGLDAPALKEMVTTISAHPDAKVREALLAVLVERWALLAPRAVVQLAVNGEAEDAARVLMLKRGFLELARVDPTEARKFALLAKGDLRVDEVLEPMFAALAETDPQLALSWLSDRELIPQKDLDQTSGNAS